MTALAFVLLGCARPIDTTQVSRWGPADAVLLAKLGLPTRSASYSCVDYADMKGRMKRQTGTACALEKPLEDGSMARVRRDDDGRILEAHRIWVMDVVAAEGRRAMVLAEFTERLGEPTRCAVGRVQGHYYWKSGEGFVMLRTHLSMPRRGSRETIMAEARHVNGRLSRC